MNYCEYCGSGYVSKKCQMCDEVIYACDCDHLCDAHECVRCGALVHKLNEGDLCDDCQNMSMKPCELCGDSTNTHEHWSGFVECVDFDACLRRQAEQGDMVAAALVDERKARKARKETSDGTRS